MMKFASLCLFSTLWILFASNTPYQSNPHQDALISCLKIRRQTPHLNLKCEDLLHADEEQEIGKPFIPFIYTANTDQSETNISNGKGDIRVLSLNDFNSTKQV